MINNDFEAPETTSSVVILNPIPKAATKTYGGLLCYGEVEEIEFSEEMTDLAIPEEIDRRYCEAAFEFEGDSSKATQHTKTTNGRVENITVLVTITDQDLARGEHKVKAVNVVAKGSHLPSIFAVNVHGGTTADGGFGSAGGNG